MFVGACHCGAVRFQVDWAIDELTTCDCSLCKARNAVMAKEPEGARTVLDGESSSRSTSGTPVARNTISAESAASMSSTANAPRSIISGSTSFAWMASIQGAFRFGRRTARR